MANQNGDPLNMDLIQMVQQGRMAHDSEAMPSKANYGYWIEAKPRIATQSPTSRSGAWIIETTGAEGDQVWQVVRDATENGELGYKSKVTRLRQVEGNVICVIYVMTYARDDKFDVERVQQALARLGISAPIRYE
ncbi:MAG: hypothetical protein OHK0023_24450 [Anaerolineae bacterium]